MTMAIKVDTDKIIKESNNFKLDLGYCYLVGTAEISAKKAFLAVSEIETYEMTNPYKRILECMSSAEREQFNEILSNPAQPLEEVRLDDAIAFVKKWALQNKLPIIDRLVFGLAYRFANEDCKSVKIAVAEMIKTAKENNSLTISVDDEQEKDFPRAQAEAFNADLQKLDNLDDIINSLYKITKGDVSKIYDSLVISLRDFFLH